MAPGSIPYELLRRATSLSLSSLSPLSSETGTMQNVLRRSYATHAGKHHRRPRRNKHMPKDKADLYYERKKQRAALNPIMREDINIIKTARQDRRSDWALGPLKPWREAAPEYGTFSRYRIDEYPPKPERDRIKDWFFRVGDRVCVVSGRPHACGKIGNIKTIDKQTDRVTIEGVNMVETRTAPQLQEAGQKPINTVEEPVPVSSIRLVYPMQDPETGEFRDCILTHLEKRNERRDPFRSFDPKQQVIFDRFLMPHNLRIPWPQEEEAEGKNEEGDTKRAEVEEISLMPTLLRPPMPEDALQELREKDKMFDGQLRAWFDVDHIEGKKAKAEEEQRLKEITKELAPRGARNLARKGSSAGGTFLSDKELLPELDAETVRIIGEHMMAVQKKQLEAEAARRADASGASTPSHAASV